MQSYYKRGDYNALCDRCGFKFKASELRKTWQGLYVCPEDFEYRNEQDFIRIQPERNDLPFVRPEAQDSFVDVCYLWERSAYAGLAVSGCIIAGNQTQTAAFLLNLKNGT